MIQVKPIENEEVITRIMTDTQLYESLTGGNSINRKQWTPIIGHTYLLVYDEEQVYGLYDVYPLTEYTYFVHSAILPKYWGKGIAIQAAKIAEDWLREAGVCKLIATVPETVRPVRNFLDRVDFKMEGYLEKGILYQDQEMGLCIYGKHIKRIQ